MFVDYISNLKRGRAALPDTFKEGGPILAVRLTEILSKIWELDAIPSEWSSQFTRKDKNPFVKII